MPFTIEDIQHKVARSLMQTMSSAKFLLSDVFRFICREQIDSAPIILVKMVEPTKFQR
jgi:hypothetical protein